jgi:DNA-binding protein H-NS
MEIDLPVFSDTLRGPDFSDRMTGAPDHIIQASGRFIADKSGAVMAVDVKSLNEKQLDELSRKIAARKNDLGKERLSRVRAKVDALLKAEGTTFAEVYGTRGRRGKRGKVAPKYRNPADPSMTWSGRGKRPRWFNAALKSGKSEKSLLIK